MASDPLYEALGVTTSPPPRQRARWGVWVGLLALAGAAAGVLTVAHRQGGTKPSDVAVASIEVAPKLPAPAPTPAAPAPAPTSPPAEPGVASVEIEHGVKIIRLGQATSSASIAIAVPGATVVPLSPAPDPRLVEQTPSGTLPRIGSDGTRPAQAYARPLGPVPAGLAGAPRIALVVGSMGLDPTETAGLSRNWPPAVTFAFPPDGPDLPTQVAETRAAGHEVVLQLPEDVDATAAPPAAPSGSPALDRLHRLMGRFAGYAGVSLSLEGKGGLHQATVGDIERRGLYLLDAASPPASASAAPRPPVRAVDVMLSSDKAALDRLVDRARTRGSAIGWIAGPNPSAEVIATFANGLAAQGIALVPLSAVADSGPTMAK